MSAATSHSSHEVTESMQLVEVYSVTDPNIAEIIKTTLQRDGISCWIEGENQGGLSGVLSIRLLTRARDAEKAEKIIETFDH